jgi:membrane protease YdiL (CAAX protease family)
MPLGGSGFEGDLGSRLVFAFTTPIVALREELFYRVILQGALERLIQPVMAILVSAALFVPYHIGMEPMNVPTVSHIISCGVLLGVIYQRTRNLWTVVIVHTILDWVVLGPPFQLVQPSTVLIANILVLLGALIWWSIDRTKQRMGI